MQDKKVVRLTIEVTKEMMLDLMIMTSERSKKVLDQADKIEAEGCISVAEGYREYADAMCELNSELSEIYKSEFVED